MKKSGGEMRWFKCLEPNNPVFIEAIPHIGKHGVYEILLVVSEAIITSTEELNTSLISNWAHLKKDRSQTILPFAQKILDETWKIYKESTGNLRKSTGNLPEISENLIDFNASNPRGRIKDRENRENRKKEPPLSPQGEKKKDSVFSERDFATASFIFNKIREINPSFRQPDLDRWANEVRLMIERDKKTHGDIETLFTWCSQDKFWRGNILSPSSLREKWDQVWIKSRTNPPKPPEPVLNEWGWEPDPNDPTRRKAPPVSL